MTTDENAKSAEEKAPVFNGPQAAALERRIRQELEEQGILTSEEANTNPVERLSNLKEIFSNRPNNKGR